MNRSIWYVLPQFFVLFPAAVSCYLPAKNQMKYTVVKTAVLCMAVLVPYSFFGAWLHSACQIDTNTILVFSLIIFFFLYRCTVKLDLPRSLSIYVGVCAIETLPAQFAYAFDASLLGNLMENAIEGCCGSPKKERYFSLTTKNHHGNSLYIVSTNSFDGWLKKGNDGYHSTKHSGKGIGLASVTAIAEKYHGSVRISNSDKEFFVDVVIKL